MNKNNLVERRTHLVISEPKMQEEKKGNIEITVVLLAHNEAERIEDASKLRTEE